MDIDEVLTQLKKLRTGVGLTADRLAASGAVMSALGESDPQRALQRMLQLLASLGDGERTRALRVDFCDNLPSMLGRQPHARERDWLGERRSGYATVIGRDVKTVARWSDRALGDLRALLLSDQFTGHLFVVAAVRGTRILGTTTIQRSDEDGRPGPESSPSVDYDNAIGEPSLPALIYGIPRDWRPASLTLAVAFQGRIYPKSIWAIVAPDFFQVSYGVERYPLQIVDDTATCRFVRPRTNRLYGIGWGNYS